MSRLIDAHEFLRSEVKRCGCVPVLGSCTSDNEIFKFVLQHQPTAFDVDKVIEEVHAYFENVIDEQDGEEIPHEILRYNKDICKIIRKGGVKND